MPVSLKTRQVLARVRKYMPGHYEIAGVSIEKAEGCWLTDVDDKKYLDMMAQYSAMGFGHSEYSLHEAVDNELVCRAGILPGSVGNSTRANAAEALARFSGFSKVIFMNSGAEAFDTAVKIARRRAYTVKGVPKNQAQIIVCKNSFHGRTLAATSASTVKHYRDGFGPFLPGIKWVEFGNADRLQRAINKRTAAFIVEPIQGEGGINIPPDGYLRDVKKICKKHDVLFVVDEVQVGFGRTGYLFGWQHDGARPDMIMLAKMLGGGAWPVSAVVGRREVMSVLTPGSHGSTFGGVPAACAAVIRVLELFRATPGLMSHINKVGEYLRNGLLEIRSSHVKEARGRGLLIGVELKPTGPPAKYFHRKLLAQGIFCGIAGERVLRFSPPLIITEEQICWALPRIEKVLKGA